MNIHEGPGSSIDRTGVHYVRLTSQRCGHDTAKIDGLETSDWREELGGERQCLMIK